MGVLNMARISTNRIVVLLAFGIFSLFTSSVGAFLIGDDYLIDGANFPINFAATHAAFNNSGDLAPEDLDGAGILTVSEEVWGLTGPNGGDVLKFRFNFFDFSGIDPSSPFGFQLSDLDWSTGSPYLLSAYMAIDFGVSALALTDVSALVAANNINPFAVQFSSGISWGNIFSSTGPPSGVNPTRIVVDFFLETSAIPAPTTLPLLGIGLLGFVIILRHRRNAVHSVL